MNQQSVTHIIVPENQHLGFETSREHKPKPIKLSSSGNKRKPCLPRYSPWLPILTIVEGCALLPSTTPYPWSIISCRILHKIIPGGRLTDINICVNYAAKTALSRRAFPNRENFYKNKPHNLMVEMYFYFFICSPRFYWYGKLTKFPFIFFLLSLAGKCTVFCKTSNGKITGFEFPRLYLELLFSYCFDYWAILSVISFYFVS